MDAKLIMYGLIRKDETALDGNVPGASLEVSGDSSSLDVQRSNT